MLLKIKKASIFLFTIVYLAITPSYAKTIRRHRRMTSITKSGIQDSKPTINTSSPKKKKIKKKQDITIFLLIGIISAVGVVIFIILQKNKGSVEIPPQPITPSPSPPPFSSPLTSPDTPVVTSTDADSDSDDDDSDDDDSDDDQPQVLTNANPYEFKNPYKVSKIDWESSTLNINNAISDLKKDLPNITSQTENGRHAWPAFVTAKLLNEEIYNDDERIKVLYKDIAHTLTESEIVERVKATKDVPYYFHSTKTVDAMCDILKSGEIKVTHSGSKPGAFVATCAPAKGYGNFTFSFTRKIELFYFPLTHYMDKKGCWVGFWKHIPLKEYLHEIFIDTSDMSKNEITRCKDKIKLALKESNYNDVKVSEKFNLDIAKAGDPLLSCNTWVVPVFWIENHQKALFFQRNSKKELEGHSFLPWKLEQLYEKKELDIFRPN